MINEVELKNFGPLNHIHWKDLGSINLVIGGNGCGKTFLLKAIYSSIRTLEEHTQGDGQRGIADILADKLYWTFQPATLGDLVTKDATHPLSCAITLNQQEFRYQFGSDTTRQIEHIENHVPPRRGNSLFLPAQEVLSLYHVLLQSQEHDRVFGFDDTYLDLAQALSQSTNGIKDDRVFAKPRRQLQHIMGGKVVYDSASGHWLFHGTNQQFPLGVTADSVKKLALLDILLSSRYLYFNSILFLDEPEATLHPPVISQFLDTIATLTEFGMQVFITTHSYFAIKKMYLLAIKRGMSVPILSAKENRWVYSDLKDEMPINPIIQESIHLYKEEVDFALG